MKYAIVLAAALVCGCGSLPSPTSSTGLVIGPEGFPTEVLGMPVLSVGGVNQLIAEGKLDGRAAAVGGWWVVTLPMTCPMPGRQPADLQDYCQSNRFSSRPYVTSTCIHNADGGSSCSDNTPPPDTDTVEPVVLGDASPGEAVFPADWMQRDNSGMPMVLIGHAGDPRAWNCPLSLRSSCARRFVVDRVAWVDGHDVPLTAAIREVQPHLTSDEATALANRDAHANAATIDPRLQETGGAVVWVVRTIGESGVDDQDPTRSLDVTVVDDATGTVLATAPVATEPNSLATISVQATAAGECCEDGDLYPFYWVSSGPGSSIEGKSFGFPMSSGNGQTRYGPALPVVLTPGTYTVTAWRSKTKDIGHSGSPQDVCSTQVTLVAGQDARVEAAFPATGECTFVAPTFEDPFGG